MQCHLPGAPHLRRGQSWQRTCWVAWVAQRWIQDRLQTMHEIKTADSQELALPPKTRGAWAEGGLGARHCAKGTFE